MTHASVPEETRKQLGISDSLIRLSVGLENPEDLVADIEQALAIVVGKLNDAGCLVLTNLFAFQAAMK